MHQNVHGVKLTLTLRHLEWVITSYNLGSHSQHLHMHSHFC